MQFNTNIILHNAVQKYIERIFLLNERAIAYWSPEEDLELPLKKNLLKSQINLPQSRKITVQWIELFF